MNLREITDIATADEHVCMTDLILLKMTGSVVSMGCNTLVHFRQKEKRTKTDSFFPPGLTEKNQWVRWHPS